MAATKSRKRINFNTNGMTLVEIIVSIALFGIVAAMTMMVLTSSLLLSIRSGDNMRQTGEASLMMDDILIDPSGTSASAVVYFKQDTSNPSDAIDGWFAETEATGNLSDARMESFIPADSATP